MAAQTTAIGTTRGATTSWLNKVPEITIYFWVIKVLCTTVGETFADFMATHFGLTLTVESLIFGAILAVALAVQMKLTRYVPFSYWLCVVLVSIFGTLVTDNLTDHFGTPLWLSTTIFSALLAVVFGVWYQSQRTLSIHTIVTLPRETFYWLAVLVTFALGTASGDWVVELLNTGYKWPFLLVVAIVALISLAHYRLGLGAVLTFWLVYILTRPLGANLGDLLSQSDLDGLGLGAANTSYIFLAAILGLVVFLTVTKRDETPHAAVDLEGAANS